MALPSVQVWQDLLRDENADLIAAAGGVDPHDAAAIDRLRKGHSQELVRAALLLAEGRRKAAAKWPAEVAARLVADPTGVEMASSALAARHKAQRFAQVLGSGREVADLCCGIGGDTMALAGAGLNVTAVDIDSARAWMAARNAGCAGVAMDVADAVPPRVPGGAFHLDPSRRNEGAGGGAHRLWQIDDHLPGPTIWRKLIEQRRSGGGGGAIKLGPGLDIAAACRVLPSGTAHEVEIISERGRLTQAVLWFGELARGHGGSRVATLLTDSGACSLRAEHVTDDAPVEPPCGPLRRYIIEADASIERAGLLALACRKDGRMTGLHPGLGLLTSDAPPHAPAPAHGPMFTAFGVLAHMPWIEKNVRAWLKEHDGGIVEVKTRGRAVDPDLVQKHLRGTGGQTYTVFVLRLGRTIEAFVTSRYEPGTK